MRACIVIESRLCIVLLCYAKVFWGLFAKKGCCWVLF